MFKKTAILLLLSVACTMSYGRSAAIQPTVDIGKGSEYEATVCNQNDFPVRFDFIAMEFIDGDFSKPQVTRDIFITPSSVGTIDDPIPPVQSDKDKGCQTYNIQKVKEVKQSRYYFLEVRQTPLVPRTGDAENSIDIVPKLYQQIAIGAGMKDQPELKGALVGDSLTIKNVGKRAIRTNGLWIKDKAYELKNRLIYSDSEGKIEAPRETIAALNDAIMRGEAVFVVNGVGTNVPLEMH